MNALKSEWTAFAVMIVIGIAGWKAWQMPQPVKVPAAATEAVYVEVPGEISAYEARKLAQEHYAKRGGLIRVRDGSGKIVATCSALGVKDDS